MTFRSRLDSILGAALAATLVAVAAIVGQAAPAPNPTTPAAPKAAEDRAVPAPVPAAEPAEPLPMQAERGSNLVTHRPEFQADLANLRRHSAKGDWGSAAAVVEGLLREDADTLCQVGNGRFAPARRTVEAAVRAAPADLLKAYRLLHDPAADALWDRAREGDAAALRKLTCELRLTRRGNQALEFAAELALDAGEPARAARLFEDRLQDSAGDLPNPRALLLVKAALAMEAGGRSADARALLARLRKESPEGVLTIGGRRVPADTWLDRRLTDAAAAAGPADAIRRPTPPDPRPAARPRWSTPLDPVVKSEFAVRHSHRRFREGPAPTPVLAPALSGAPLIAGDRLLLQTLTKIWAIDIRSGRVLWSTANGRKNQVDNEDHFGHGSLHPDRLAMSAADGRVFRLGAVREGMPGRSDAMRLVAHDAVDGRPLWWIAGAMAVGEPKMAAPWPPAGVIAPKPPGDIEEEGPGPEKPVPPGNGPAVAPAPVPPAPLPPEALPIDAVFLTAPTPAGGRLYVPFVSTESVWIACLNAADGKVIWRKKFVRTPADRQDFLINGSPVLVSDGTIYVLTNGGVLAALDAADGETLWLVVYAPLNPLNFNQENGDERFNRSGQPLFLEGGVLFGLPTDLDSLVVVNPADGSPHAMNGLPRHRREHLLGLHEGLPVLAGPGVVLHARRRPVLRDYWDLTVDEISSKTVVAGRPLLTRESVYLPIAADFPETYGVVPKRRSNGELVPVVPERQVIGLQRIALGAKATVSDLPYGADATDGGFLLGTLVAEQGRLLSINGSQVHAFFDLDQELATLAGRPTDVRARLDRGRLLQSADRWPEAAADLREARRLSETPPFDQGSAETSAALFTVLFALADRTTDPAARQVLLQEAEGLVGDDPPRRASLELELARAEIATGRGPALARAAARLYRLLEEPDVGFDSADAEGRRKRSRFAASVESRTWEIAEATLTELSAKHGRAPFALLDAEGASRLAASAEAGEGVEAIATLMRVHAAGGIAPELMLELARRHALEADREQARGRTSDAEKHLRAANDRLKMMLEDRFEDSPLRATAVAGLADLSVRAPWRYVPLSRSWQRKLSALPEDAVIRWPTLMPVERAEFLAGLRARIAALPEVD